jgi:hypothetical protein
MSVTDELIEKCLTRVSSVLFFFLTHPAPASGRRPSLREERGRAPQVRRGESTNIDHASDNIYQMPNSIFFI